MEPSGGFKIQTVNWFLQIEIFQTKNLINLLFLDFITIYLHNLVAIFNRITEKKAYQKYRKETF